VSSLVDLRQGEGPCDGGLLLVVESGEEVEGEERRYPHHRAVSCPTPNSGSVPTRLAKGPGGDGAEGDAEHRARNDVEEDAPEEASAEAWASVPLECTPLHLPALK